jgi:hypothetical protein
MTSEPIPAEIMQRAIDLRLTLLWDTDSADEDCERIARAIMEAEARGEAKVDKWKQAASDLQDLIATPIDIIEQRARAEGYAAAREQAATNIEDAGGSMAEYYAGMIRAMEMSDE